MRALIRLGLEAFALPGVGRLFAASGGRGLIFTLHHVRPAGRHEDGPNAHLSIRPDSLEAAIAAALAAGLTPVRLHELPALLADPDDRRRFVAFTLDDGYRNNAEHAAPLFRKAGVPFTIFITPGFVERRRSAWWETAEAMLAGRDRLSFDFGTGEPEMACGTPRDREAAFARFAEFIEARDEDEAVAAIDAAAARLGVDPLAIVDDLVMDDRELRRLAESEALVDFGAHSMSHVNLKRVGPARLAAEIGDSARIVAGYGRGRPASFAYPYGKAHAVGEREFDAAARAGFACAVTTMPGMLGGAVLARPTAIPRISLNGLFQTPRHIRALLTGMPARLG